MAADAACDIQIREATSADCELVAALVATGFRDVAERFGLTFENCPAHPSNCSAEWIARDLARGVTHYILTIDEQPCGSIALSRKSDGTWTLQRLCVLPAHRGRGNGAALVRYVLDLASRAGPGRIELAIVGWDSELQRWYEQLGFRATGTRTFEHLPFPVIFMARSTGRSDSRFAQFLRYLWVLPTSLPGLACLPLTLFGGGAVILDGVLELHGRPIAWMLRHLTALKGGASAMTLGHVVIGRNADLLVSTRSHERVHVRQCERWGPLFFPAYLLASLWAMLRGREAYRDNPFECQARDIAARHCLQGGEAPHAHHASVH